MILELKNCLLYIHPKGFKSEKPVLDDIFYKLYQAIYNGQVTRGVVMQNGQFVPNLSTRGFHECTGKSIDGKYCPHLSQSSDLCLTTKTGDHLYTNSLALHYLAYHREEVPESELEKIDQLPDLPNDYQKVEFIDDSKNENSYWNLY